MLSKMALVNDNKDKGAVDDIEVLKIELEVILKKFYDLLSVDCSWERGHCIYECVSKWLKEFLCKCIDTMDLEMDIKV